MKFTILQSKLLEAIQIIAGVVPTRSTNPVLENILFELDGNILKITGTDLEISVTTQVEVASSEMSGALALPARVMTEMIRSLPDISIQFESDESNRLKITTNQGLYTVSGITKDIFPSIPQPDNENIISMSNKKLGRMFKKTIFAVSSEELRPALMGIYIQILPDEFRMVSTDGHRLSKIIDRDFHSNQNTIQMIIPPKAVQLALKNLNEEGNTQLSMQEDGLFFKFGKTILYTRLVDGEYPDYERVIPRDNDKTLIVDKNALIASAKRVSLFSSALTHQIKFSISTGKMIIQSEDLDIGGDAREEINAEYNDEEMEIGYNAQYLMDILRHIDTDEVHFLIKSPIRATLITPAEQEKNESFIMLIMPIKLGS